jgi:spore coat-associated protein N
MTATTTTAPARSSRRRALVPLATLLAAAALAMASGATFTSWSENPANRYETGSLDQVNNLDGEAIFDLDNLKPGDSVTGRVTITNSGTLPATFKLTETAEANENTFVDKDKLSLVVTNVADGDEVYNGTLGSFGSRDLDGTWADGESRTYTFKASLAADADNANQDAFVKATYRWDATQLDGEDYVQDLSVTNQ